MVCEPNPVLGEKKLMSLLVHSSTVNSQNEKFSVPDTDPARRLEIRREVHMLAAALNQPLCLYRSPEPGGRAMEEFARRLLGGQFQVHIPGVPLVRPYSGAVVIECKAFLVIGFDDLFQQLQGKGIPLAFGTADELIYIGPSIGIQPETRRLRLMPKHKAYEFAISHQ